MLQEADSVLAGQCLNKLLQHYMHLVYVSKLHVYVASVSQLSRAHQCPMGKMDRIAMWQVHAAQSQM